MNNLNKMYDATKKNVERSNILLTIAKMPPCFGVKKTIK